MAATPWDSKKIQITNEPIFSNTRKILSSFDMYLTFKTFTAYCQFYRFVIKSCTANIYCLLAHTYYSNKSTIQNLFIAINTPKKPQSDCCLTKNPDLNCRVDICKWRLVVPEEFWHNYMSTHICIKWMFYIEIQCFVIQKNYKFYNFVSLK